MAAPRRRWPDAVQLSKGGGRRARDCDQVSVPADGYRIYAVRYGHRDHVPAWEAFHKEHAEPSGGMDYFVWAITDGTRTVVVDTGYGEEEGTRRGRQFLRSPAAGLAEIGIAAGDVEDVVLTHFHYDHIGGQALFPKARFWVQEEEMRFYTGPS